MKYLMYSFFFFILVGCENSEMGCEGEGFLLETIVHQPIQEDCGIWMDLLHSNSPKVIIGHSGACKMLNMSEYAKHIKRILKEFPINKQKNVKIIHINSYETDGILTQDLLNKISESKSWNLTSENCNKENLDKEFHIFNNKEKYLHEIEEVITEEFGRIKKTEFMSMKPYKSNTFKINKEKCYPDSFGAMYTISDS